MEAKYIRGRGPGRAGAQTSSVSQPRKEGRGQDAERPQRKACLKGGSAAGSEQNAGLYHLQESCPAWKARVVWGAHLAAGGGRVATPRWGSTYSNQRHARTNSCAFPPLRGRLRLCRSEPAQRRRKPSAGGGSSGPLIHSSRGGSLPTVNFLLLRPATPTNERTDIVCKAIPSTSFRGWLLKEQARVAKDQRRGRRRRCQSVATTGTRFPRQSSLRRPVLLILGQGSVSPLLQKAELYILLTERGGSFRLPCAWNILTITFPLYTWR